MKTNMYVLFKNGKPAKLSQDMENILATFHKLNGDGNKYTMSTVQDDLPEYKATRSNHELGLRNDGSPKISNDVSKAIGDAFERVGIMYDDVDWTSDYEWKTRERVDKLNNMD
jgi:hypothetical protein